MGFGLATSLRAPGTAKGSAFLRDFSLATLTTQAGQPSWNVLEDRVYDPATGPGGRGAIARRIVAHTAMPVSEQNGFATRLDEAISAWLVSQNGTQKGVYEANESSARKKNEEMIQTLIHAPRKFYQTGDTHGVLDVSCIGVNGEVTVIISITEDS